jgi:hypothetical protein
MNKEVRRFVARLNDVPGVEVTQGKTHLRVMKDGKMVGAIPKTPSDRRWQDNALSDLRRAGITPASDVKGPPKIKPARDPEALRDSLKQLWSDPTRGEKTRIAKFIQQYAEANGLRGYPSIDACLVSLSGFSTGKVHRPHEWVLFLLEQSLPHYHRVSRQVDLTEGGTETAPITPSTIAVTVDLDTLVMALATIGITLEVS